jgi:hypothetical protein
VDRIVDLLDMQGARTPFVSDTEVELGITHTVAGNPSRFKTGKVSLRADDEWISKMRTSDKALVTAMTWPSLLRYGYPIRA